MIPAGALLACAVLLAPRMDAIRDEITVGGSLRSDGTKTLYLQNAFLVSVAFGDQWVLDAGYNVSKSGDFSVVHVPSLGATFAANENWLVLATAQYAPPSVNNILLCRGTDTPLCVFADESVFSAGGAALVAYESAGGGAVEGGFDVSYAPTYYGLRYVVTSGLASGTERALNFFQHRVGATGVLHFGRWLDVELRGAYTFFVNSEAAALQRALAQAAGGLPIAPRTWEAQPVVTGHFLDRKLRVQLSGAYAPYADACLGQWLQGTLRLSGRIHRVRVFGSLTLQRDLPPETPTSACEPIFGVTPLPTTSGYVSVGAEYLFE
ncbi:MAG: hypothetical protein ACKVPX_13055 [Myxococcaceae bacterium]